MVERRARMPAGPSTPGSIVSARSCVAPTRCSSRVAVSVVLYRALAPRLANSGSAQAHRPRVDHARPRRRGRRRRSAHGRVGIAHQAVGARATGPARARADEPIGGQRPHVGGARDARGALHRRRVRAGARRSSRCRCRPRARDRREHLAAAPPGHRARGVSHVQPRGDAARRRQPREHEHHPDRRVVGAQLQHPGHVGRLRRAVLQHGRRDVGRRNRRPCRRCSPEASRSADSASGAARAWSSARSSGSSDSASWASAGFRSRRRPTCTTRSRSARPPGSRCSASAPRGTPCACHAASCGSRRSRCSSRRVRWSPTTRCTCSTSRSSRSSRSRSSSPG